MSEQSSPSSRSCRPPRPEVSGPAPQDVQGRLQWLVSAHLDVDPDRLHPEVRLGEDLCVDSLAAIELTMVIEDEFDISLPESDVAGVRTYGDVLALVTARAGANGA
ncbi:MAG: acyl carrier protein [Acidimicrobiia bacterium]